MHAVLPPLPIKLEPLHPIQIAKILPLSLPQAIFEFPFIIGPRIICQFALSFEQIIQEMPLVIIPVAVLH